MEFYPGDLGRTLASIRLRQRPRSSYSTWGELIEQEVSIGGNNEVDLESGDVVLIAASVSCALGQDNDLFVISKRRTGWISSGNVGGMND